MDILPSVTCNRSAVFISASRYVYYDYLSLSIAGASFMAYAMACALSIAGIMPSVLDKNSKHQPPRHLLSQHIPHGPYHTDMRVPVRLPDSQVPLKSNKPVQSVHTHPGRNMIHSMEIPSFPVEMVAAVSAVSIPLPAASHPISLTSLSSINCKCSYRVRAAAHACNYRIRKSALRLKDLFFNLFGDYCLKSLTIVGNGCGPITDPRT